MDADLQHVAGNLVRVDDFVVGHEHEHGVQRTPALDAIERLYVQREKVILLHADTSRASARSRGRATMSKIRASRGRGESGVIATDRSLRSNTW